MATAKERKKFVQDFEAMREDAELRALSNASMQRCLSNDEYARMKELANKRFKRLRIRKVS